MAVEYVNTLTDLQRWYQSNCDGDWEQEFGVVIETLDNPGWSVAIDLRGTNLEGREFQPINDESAEGSWIACRVEESRFRGAGDPGRLEEILAVFLNWARSQNDNWLEPPAPISQDQQRKDDDDRFFASLLDEVEFESCRREGCSRYRIRNSAMCSVHHFEMVTGRPAPEAGNP